MWKTTVKFIKTFGLKLSLNCINNRVVKRDSDCVLDKVYNSCMFYKSFALSIKKFTKIITVLKGSKHE